MRSTLLARLVTLLLWAAVAASAAFWGLRLFAPATPVPANATAVGTAGAARGDPTRLLGEAAPAPVAVAAPAPSRYRLIGVVAPRADAAAPQGLAVIEIDGKPARAYRVGATVDDRLVLQRVHARGAELAAQGAAPVALTLAPVPVAATGRPGAPVPLPGAVAPRPLPPRPVPGMGAPAPLPESDDSSEPADTLPEATPPGLPQRPGVATQ